jgi:alpha-acetolactate decarboxylase
MHFLNDDKTKGGHVFAFAIKHAVVSVMQLHSVYIETNQNASFIQLNNRKDRPEELKKIE